MRTRLKIRIITAGTIITLFAVFGMPTPGAAQPWLMLAGPTARLLSSMPIVGNMLNSDFPGIANPRMPFVFPPMFRGEIKARAIYLFPQKQEFSNPELGFATDLESDLGFNDEGGVIELMARAQIGRFSVRAQYDEWLETFKSANGHLNWPVYRMGLDVDLYNNAAFRFGVNCDINWDEPILSAAVPNQRTFSIEWDRPMTAGLYVSYNPFGYGSIALSLDSRVRWPISANSRITEFEIAGGLKGPTTVTGASALRGGWRYTSIELRKGNNFELDIVWSGIFAEYVYMY